MSETFTFNTPAGFLRIHGWPELRAEHSHNGTVWSPDSPVWSFFIPEADKISSRAFLGANALDWFNCPARIAFCATVPEEICVFLASFTDHQWNLLELFKKNEKATRDLMISSPVLAYALANAEVFRYIPAGLSAERAQWLLSDKQRNVLKWLKFPAQQSIAKMFRKLQPASLGIHQIRLLRAAIQKEPRVMKLLSHLPRINASIVSILYDLRILPMLTEPLLIEMAAQDAPVGIADFLIDTYALHVELMSENPLPAFRNITQLQNYHDRLTKLYNHLIQQDLQNQKENKIRKAQGKYGQPPVPGTEHIIPIISYEELVQEGVSQCHCVASYHSQILERTTFVYKVTYPERSTLQLKKSFEGAWSLCQLRAKANRSVKKETLHFINDWLLISMKNQNVNKDTCTKKHMLAGLGKAKLSDDLCR